MLEKEWFKKVDAFEEFTDYWAFGRGIKSFPTRGVYYPVRSNIMLRPKFRNYDKEDMSGKTFSLLTKDNHTVSPAFEEHSSLTAEGFKPPIQSKNKSTYATYAYKENGMKAGKMKWDSVRLNKTKRQKNDVSRVPQMIWRFSTFIDRGQQVPRQQTE